MAIILDQEAGQFTSIASDRDAYKKLLSHREGAWARFFGATENSVGQLHLEQLSCLIFSIFRFSSAFLFGYLSISLCFFTSFL